MDIRNEIIKSLKFALSEAGKHYSLSSGVDIFLEIPPKAEFGDFSTNIAMQICKQNKGLRPQEIAVFITKKLNDYFNKSKLSGYIKDIVIKQPGFINFFITNNALYDVLLKIFKEKENYGKNLNIGKNRKAMVEFVSANPTGPLTVAHARQAVVGEAISNILEFFGWRVCREYYLNDEGNQIEILARSVYSRYAQLCGIDFSFPENGYKGDYIYEIAKIIYDKHGKKFSKFEKKENIFFQNFSVDFILKGIKKDLQDIKVKFDNYMSQKKMAHSGKIEKTLNILKKKNFIYEKDSAWWFKSTEFGDDKDRVLIKSDKTYTYITPDIAYHDDKYKRGFKWIIDIWGPDHHGYIPRIKASQQALGRDAGSLTILIVQLVSVLRGGNLVRMSTRSGEFIALRDIIDEVGAEAAKFFFLMRKISTHLDFDLQLAKTQSMDNPVYYIQYAHARICGILKQDADNNISKTNLSLLKQEHELQMIKKMQEYPEMLKGAYEGLEPYRIIDYLIELTSAFHSFYAQCRVISEDKELTHARKFLVICVKIVVSNALNILGISQPERM